MRTFLRVLCLCPFALVAIFVGALPAHAYEAPVNAPVLDPYRAPANPYGPGNRGVDYATTPGSQVDVSAPGTVTFAGQVGGTLYVVVDHGDGLRTTYGLLQSIAVIVGQVLQQSDVIGQASDDLHFGARRGDEYIDPLSILTADPVHLVPVDAPPVRSASTGVTDLLTDVAWQWLSEDAQEPQEASSIATPLQARAEEPEAGGTKTPIALGVAAVMAASGVAAYRRSELASRTQFKAQAG